jgi:hypothetical protein
MQEFGQDYMVAWHDGFRRVEAWTIVLNYSRFLFAGAILLLRADAAV